jgi:hypothetical protein
MQSLLYEPAEFFIHAPQRESPGFRAFLRVSRVLCVPREKLLFPR